MLVDGFGKEGGRLGIGDEDGGLGMEDGGLGMEDGGLGMEDGRDGRDGWITP